MEEKERMIGLWLLSTWGVGLGLCTPIKRFLHSTDHFIERGIRKREKEREIKAQKKGKKTHRGQL